MSPSLSLPVARLDTWSRDQVLVSGQRGHSEGELVANLRHRLEILNDYTFTDSEWKRFFADAIANPNEHIPEKTRKIQEDYVQVLKRDDGSSKNITRCTMPCGSIKTCA